MLVGAKTHISDMSRVTKSMIGNNCTIGKNVVIHGSHIMNNVVIEDNSQIINSFIDDNCIVEMNSTLEGVVASDNVCIKVGSNLKGNILEETDKNGNEIFRQLFLRVTAEFLVT